MNEFKQLETNEELEQMWQDSIKSPVLLFKHSTTCPISAGAFEQYQAFLESANENLNSYMVKVTESRDVSKQIATETNVNHQSPQILLIKNKEVLWNTSHSKITVDSINSALQRVK